MADMSNYAAFMSTHPAMEGHNKDTEQTLKLAMLAHGHNMQTQAGLYSQATQGAEHLDQQAAVQEMLHQMGIPRPQFPGPIGDSAMMLGSADDFGDGAGGPPLYNNPVGVNRQGSARDLVTDPGKPIAGPNGKVRIPYQLSMIDEGGKLVGVMGPRDKPLYGGRVLEDPAGKLPKSKANLGSGMPGYGVDAYKEERATKDGDFVKDKDKQKRGLLF